MEHTEDLHIPTTLLTQFGIIDALPKLERGKVKPYSGYRDAKTGRWHKVEEGYVKRSKKKERQ